MPYSFPRAIPDDLRIVSAPFTLKPQHELTPLRSGKKIAADLGPAIWMTKYNSAPLTMMRFGVARAWINTLLSTKEFYGFDYFRQYPLAYVRTHFTGLTFGGNPWGGTCKLSYVAANNVEVALYELPAGFLLSRGDYLSFDYGADSRALHQVVETKAAGGDGILGIEVRPHVRAGWTVDAPVTFHRAAARMFIIPESLDDPVERGIGRISFSAVQTL